MDSVRYMGKEENRSPNPCKYSTHLWIVIRLRRSDGYKGKCMCLECIRRRKGYLSCNKGITMFIFITIFYGKLNIRKQQTSVTNKFIFIAGCTSSTFKSGQNQMCRWATSNRTRQHVPTYSRSFGWKQTYGVWSPVC